MIKETLQKSFSFLKSREKLSAALLFIAAICIVYAPIVFFNKSLQPSLFYPLNGVVDTGAYGYEGRIPINSFNIDMTNGLYFNPPWDRFIGDSYKKGELVLWTPYQASGIPLPDLYGSAGFFPFQILKDIFPTRTWDFFVLAQFWIAGFFTYLFLRLLKLSPLGSFLGGLFFMFSGSFTLFWANAPMTNQAMLIPVLLWGLERLFQNQRAKDIVLSAFIFACLFLVGNPGGIIYTLLLAGVYFIFRVVTAKIKGALKVKYILLLLLVFVLALEFAAPQILPFIKFLPLSFNLRDPAYSHSFGTQSVNWRYLGYVFAPGVAEVPVEYRIMPGNGVWDASGGYTGMLSIFLIVLGCFIFFKIKILEQEKLSKHFFFFLIFGLFILLKNFGLPPFTWLGKLPLFSMTWSPRWGSQVWVFSFAAAGAIGFEALKRLKRGIKLTKLLVILVLSIFFIFALLILAIVKSHDLGFEGNYSYFSLLINCLAVVLTLIISGWLLWYYKKTGKGLYGLVSLAIFELWFWIPRGYNNLWQVFELILFLIGLAIVAIVATGNKWRLALVGLTIFFLLFSIMDLMAPNGYPLRYDPFTRAPYINFLQEQKGYFRIVGIDGILVPNLSNVFGLMDVRHINGISIITYHNFSYNNLRKYRFNQDTLSGAHAWFNGVPQRFSNTWLSCQHLINNDITMGTEYTISRRLEEEIRDMLPLYSLLGVKYILAPKSRDINADYNIKSKDEFYFPLVYQNEINIFENPKVFPRAFIAGQVDYVSSWQDAQDKILEPDFDLRNKVLLEEKIPSDCCKSPNPENNSSITIKDYKNNEVIIEASTEKPGILVLSDVFYPGWEAEIDNQPTKIYRVDGLLRGIYLEPGSHAVVFKYSPKIFKIGFLVTLMALLSCGGLLIFPKKIRKKKNGNFYD